MRYIYKDNEGYYVLEKSITHEEAPPSSMKVVRGTIDISLWALYEKENETLLVYQTQISNGGYASQYQDN